MTSNWTAAKEVWPHLWFPSAFTSFGPWRDQSGTCLRRGSCFWDERATGIKLLSRITDSLLHIPENWPVLGLRKCCFQNTNLSGHWREPTANGETTGYDQWILTAETKWFCLSFSSQTLIYNRTLSRLSLRSKRTWIAGSQATEFQKLKVALAGTILVRVANF